MRSVACPACRTYLLGVTRYTLPPGRVRFDLAAGGNHSCTVRGAWPPGWCARHGSWACGLTGGSCSASP